MPTEGEKAVGNRRLHDQRSKESSNAPGAACLGCCPQRKGSLQTEITILSCNEMLIQLLLSQLLLPWLKITAWVRVSPGQPTPWGRKGMIVLGGLEPFLISTRQTAGSIIHSRLQRGMIALQYTTYSKMVE